MNKLYLLTTLMLITILSSITTQAQSPNLADGLIAYWKLDETSGPVIESVSGLNGVNNGATPGVSGIINTGYNFQGGGSNLNLGQLNGQINTQMFTYSLWLNNPSGNYGYALSAGITINRLAILVGPNQAIATYLDTSSGGIQSPFVQTQGGINHIAMTYNGSVLNSYFNGVQFSSLIGESTLLQNAVLRLGNGVDGSNPYLGGIDEVGYWNRALNASEVSMLYNNGNGLSYNNIITPPILPNLPPTLSVIGNQQIVENQTLSIQLQATDPNSNDTLVYLTNAQTTLPSTSFLNSNTGVFTWTPTFNDQGFYTVNFYVTDGQFVDYEAITIQVVDVSFATISMNGAPTLGSTVTFNLHDPLNSNKPYKFSLAFNTVPGIPLIDGRIIPLNEDWLFNAILFAPQLFGLSDASGTLNNQGDGQVTWNIPNIAGAQGLNIYGSFTTLDYSKPWPQTIVSIAPAINITLQ